jgi:hypothetical protein
MSTRVSAAGRSGKSVGKMFRAVERSGIAADKNVRQECPRAWFAVSPLPELVLAWLAPIA